MVVSKYYCLLNRQMKEIALFKYLDKEKCYNNFCDKCLTKEKIRCLVLEIAKKERRFKKNMEIYICDFVITNLNTKEIMKVSHIIPIKEEELVTYMLRLLEE